MSAETTMRDLIKPTLFIIARTGLFLAVMAWAVAPWWRLQVMGCGLSGLLVQEGWLFCQRTAAELSMSSGEQSVVPYEMYEYSANGQPRSFASRFGVGFNNGSLGHVAHVSFRHAFVVTLFTAFNFLLHLIYHKRLEVQQCEN